MTVKYHGFHIITSSLSVFEWGPNVPCQSDHAVAHPSLSLLNCNCDRHDSVYVSLYSRLNCRSWQSGINSSKGHQPLP